MALSKLRPVRDTFKVLVNDPFEDGPMIGSNGSEMYLDVYGPHTKEYKEARHEQHQILLGLMQEDGKVSSMDPDALEDSTYSFLASIVKGGYLEVDEGEDFKITKESIKSVLKDYPTVKDQVSEVDGNLTLFMKG